MYAGIPIGDHDGAVTVVKAEGGYVVTIPPDRTPDVPDDGPDPDDKPLAELSLRDIVDSLRRQGYGPGTFGQLDTHRSKVHVCATMHDVERVLAAHFADGDPQTT